MTNILQVQINIVLAILMASLFIHAYLKMNTKTATNRVFMWMMGLTCLTLVLEIFSVLLNGPEMRQWIVLHKLVNVAGFMISPCIPFIAYIFCKEWAGRFQKDKEKVHLLLDPLEFHLKKTTPLLEKAESIPIAAPHGFQKSRKHAMRFDYILLLPLLVNGIGSLMSFSGGQLFRVTSGNIYERGPLFFILPCVSFLYFFYCLLFIFLNNKKFLHSEILLFSMFCVVPTIFTIVQIKFLNFLTTWSSAAFIIIITYVFILNDQVYRDSLTGLENRLSYEHYCQKIRHKRKSDICMIYIDIDNFKSINDQYGHSEGDEAIKIFANLIADSFALRRKRIMRFGGDEFLVIAEEPQQPPIDACLEALTKNIKEFNQNGKKPYNLDFSFGMGRYSDEYRNMNELMDIIDHKMYINKQMKKDFYG